MTAPARKSTKLIDRFGRWVNGGASDGDGSLPITSPWSDPQGWAADPWLNPQGWDYYNLNSVRWYACMRFERRLAYLDWIIAIRQAELNAHNAVSPDGDKRLFDYAANRLAVRLRHVQKQRRIALLDREPLRDWYQDYPRKSARSYIHSGRWRRIRRRKLVSVNYRCEQPGCKGSATACHHKHYDTLGFEENDDLKALCFRHHVARHSGNRVTAAGKARRAEL